MKYLRLWAGIFCALLAAPRIHADYIYASMGNNTVMQFTQAGVGSVYGNVGLTAPRGLDFDSSGTLFVANLASSTIEKFAPGGAASLFYSGVPNPLGLAIDGLNNVYVPSGGAIVRITPGGTLSTFASTFLNGPEGLAFDVAGNLYAANSGNATITKFNPAGSMIGFFSTGGFAPYGLAIDNTGNLLVSYRSVNRIEKFSPTGVDLGIFASGGSLSQPYGIAVDSIGDLYVANSGNGTIEKFTPAGVGSIFASGLPGAQFVTTVPEPSSCWLAALGFAIVNYRLRQARANAGH
jgi:streptogramin lyase